MTTLVQTFFAFFVSCFRSRAVLQIENTMLRHQLNVYAAVRQSRDFAPWWSSPRFVDGLRLGIQAVHCGGCGFSVGHILLS